jgi:hypothetical protein
VRVIGVEPEISTAMIRGRGGEPVPVEPRSIADGLNAPFAGTSLAAARARGGGRAVSENEIRMRSASSTSAPLACSLRRGHRRAPGREGAVRARHGGRHPGRQRGSPDCL